MRESAIPEPQLCPLLVENNDNLEKKQFDFTSYISNKVHHNHIRIPRRYSALYPRRELSGEHPPSTCP